MRRTRISKLQRTVSYNWLSANKRDIAWFHPKIAYAFVSHTHQRSEFYKRVVLTLIIKNKQIADFIDYSQQLRLRQINFCFISAGFLVASSRSLTHTYASEWRRSFWKEIAKSASRFTWGICRLFSSKLWMTIRLISADIERWDIFQTSSSSFVAARATSISCWNIKVFFIG